MLIDSHCHLHLMDLTDDGNDVMQPIHRAREAGVKHMLCVSTERSDIPIVKALAAEHSDISASVGIHPSESMDKQTTPEELLAWADDTNVVAIGETGLDYYYNKEEAKYTFMQKSFREHVQVACQCKKPLIIHTRDAVEDTLTILREEGADQIGGVMHCFTESIAMAEAAMALGFYISFSGIVTFKNAKNVQAVAEAVPLEKMLIETDAPWLAPVPHRGRQNEPAYVAHVASYLSQLKGVSQEELITITGKNACDLFQWGELLL